MDRPFNPCEDGFEAKVWECLRRNVDFKQDFEKAQNQGPQLFLRRFFFHWNEAWAKNVFARELLCSPAGWNTSKSWPEIQMQVREKLRAVNRTREAVRWPKMNLSEWQHAAGSKIKFIGFLLKTERENRPYLNFGIPAFIRDQAHRDRIKAQLDAWIPQPQADARYFKATGRMLGTKKEWEAYLLNEGWVAKGLSKIRARALVSLEMHEPATFRAYDERFLLSEEGKAVASSVDQQRGSHPVGTRIATIREQIKSVYPVFQPFVGKS